MVTINLLPQLEQERTLAKVLRPWAALIISAVVLGAAGTALWWLRSSEQKQIVLLQNEARAVQAERVDYRDREEQVRQLQQQVDAAEKLLGDHQRWSNFFALVETNTKTEVEFTSVTGSPAAGVVLNGRTDSMETVAQQLRAFETAPKVLAVALGNTERQLNTDTGAEEITFSLTLQLDAALFSEEPAPIAS